jgi:ribonucleoside-diphosphate reductase alpha chain
MGFAEMLIMLGMRYDTKEAVSFAEKLMSFIQHEAKQKSRELAEERGSFPNIDKSIYAGEAMRNATVTTIAPTGTISIIAGTSSGIEPLFAISFIRNVMEGIKLLEVNPLFERIARERGFYSTELMMKIAKTGSIQDIKEVPRDVRELFVTAMDIAPEWHVRMQAAFQRHVDNAVSKTINLPHDASLEDVRNAFWLAYELKCKGITVYRYGSKREQVLYIGSILKKETDEEHISADAEYSGGCPTRECIV